VVAERNAALSPKLHRPNLCEVKNDSRLPTGGRGEDRGKPLERMGISATVARFGAPLATRGLSGTELHLDSLALGHRANISHTRCGDGLRSKLAATSALLAALVLAAGCATTAGGGGPAAMEPASAMPRGDSPSRGTPGAPIRIIEFSDYQCPYSAKLQDTFTALLDAFPGEIELIYKHNPLSTHPEARGAAMAAIFAQDQGKFWQLHAALFENSQKLSQEELRRHAAAVGIDPAKLDAAFEDAKVKAQLYADSALAAKFGATSTPTYFINGRKLVGAQTLAQLSAEVEAERARVKMLLESGVPRERAADVLTELQLATAQPNSGTAAAERRERPSEDDKVIYPVTYDREHLSVGMPEDKALVTVVVFNDYQCPFCARLEPVVTDLLRNYQGKIRVVYRDLPLPMHTDAHLAAQAARAAGDQGKHLEAHRYLLANSASLGRADLVRMAYSLGLDPARFEAALETGRHAAEVDADVEDCRRLNISGTPTSFVNGRRVTGAKPTQDFVKVVDEELARATAMSKEKNLTGRSLYLRLVGAQDQ
jgi:protein-disulfide isomerase